MTGGGTIRELPQLGQRIVRPECSTPTVADWPHRSQRKSIVLSLVIVESLRESFAQSKGGGSVIGRKCYKTTDKHCRPKSGYDELLSSHVANFREVEFADVPVAELGYAFLTR